VWPHCGPTNARLRIHLGLEVPQNCCRIRVKDETRQWAEGEVLILDDSFEHELWNTGNGRRIILIVDVLHPNLNSEYMARQRQWFAWNSEQIRLETEREKADEPAADAARPRGREPKRNAKAKSEL